MKHTACSGAFSPYLRFESSVVLYGTQTMGCIEDSLEPFESSVVLYGTQTLIFVFLYLFMFESSVVLYGTQT